MPKAAKPQSRQLSISKATKKTKTPTVPETADDFQELADEEESRGGKWRAGDTAKAARAFERAITFYEQGLQRHPNSFDLAYNKARLELEVSQQPALLPHWRITRSDFLAQALTSHKRALAINNDDVDLLFNTAQVLTSLSEELSGIDREQEAVPALHEALEALSSCLAKQEIILEQQTADIPEDDDEDAGGVSLGDDLPVTQDAEPTEESAVVIQPITPSDLLDTVHASMSALTTLAGLENEQALSNLDGMARTIYDKKAMSYIALLEPGKQDQARLTVHLDRAIFVCALANARFAAREIEFTALLDSLTTFDISDKASHADVCTAQAEATAEVVLSALDSVDSGIDLPLINCWKPLQSAQDALTQASKLNDDTARDLKVQIYKQKGDIELLRIRVASSPQPSISDAIRSSRAVLLKNARTYYKGAVAHAASSDESDDAETAADRLKAVQFLMSLDSHDHPAADVELAEIITDLVDEGYLEGSIIDRLAALGV